ncbi:MAG: hypothetical protein U1F23_04920 [Lysobacterales bacterium]
MNVWRRESNWSKPTGMSVSICDETWRGIRQAKECRINSLRVAEGRNAHVRRGFNIVVDPHAEMRRTTYSTGVIVKLDVVRASRKWKKSM